MNDLAPKVSVGLPVYNGECHLGAAIESILAQTYPNFEVIISDNASIDRTEEICRCYAARDARIRYYRQPTNLGAAPNFNLVFELAQASKYFKWAAHDDWIASNFLEECVYMLENNPDAVLCQTLVENVDANGAGFPGWPPYDHTGTGGHSPRPSDRFLARLKDRRCIGVYGVIRSDVLASTNLMGSHHSGDAALLVELALCGRFLLVPRPLFFNRHFSGNFSLRLRGVCTPREELAWWSTRHADGQPAWRCWKTWVMYSKYLRSICDRIESRSERLRCYAHLLHPVCWRNWVNFILEPLAALHPRLFHVVRQLKQLYPRARVAARS